MAPVPDAVLEHLLERARAASSAAYCPYSRFAVGAALLAGDGIVYEGCNVENASYGLTICAERNAVFQMVARGSQRIEALALYTPTPEPAAPCGACLQVISEFGADSQIVIACAGEMRRTLRFAELLPLGFNLDASVPGRHAG